MLNIAIAVVGLGLLVKKQYAAFTFVVVVGLLISFLKSRNSQSSRKRVTCECL